MDSLLDAIKARRSVRNYAYRQVDRATLERIVEAGIWAPSARNIQNWFFSAIQDGGVIRKVNGWIKEELRAAGNLDYLEVIERNGGSVFRNAKAVVVVATTDSEKNSIANCSAAIENMLLAATSLGVGSCWTGSVDTLGKSARVAQYAKELGMPESFIPQYGIALGYPADANLAAPARAMNVVSYI